MSHDDSPLLFPSLNYRELPPPIWRRLRWERRGRSERGVHKPRDGPSLVGHAQRLRGRRAQGFVSAAKIIVRDVQRDRRNVVIQLFAKAIGQPGDRREDMRSERFWRST